MQKLHVTHAEIAPCVTLSRSLDAGCSRNAQAMGKRASEIDDRIRIRPMAIMTNRPVGAGFGATRVLADLVGRIAAWNDARVTRKSLSALTDRELDDLGLVRGDIEDIARGTYTRD
jgi:uncharacterized protein YjiS (DUF1127 family)